MGLGCLDENTARSFAAGRLDRAARMRAVEHLVTCDACRRRVVLGQAAASGAARGVDLDTSSTVRLDSSLSPGPRASGGVPPVAPPMPRGTIVGRYTLLDLVGRGGVGEVYAAYDPKLDRRVALKLLRAEQVAPETSHEARLLREAQAMAKVSHPNVVTVHDVGTHGDRVFLAMEFIDGATLKDWLAAAPRKRREILAVFGAAARGLVAAHAAGLVHRDFKPGNVMVARDGAVHVMDFGLVRQLGATGGPGVVTASGDGLPHAPSGDAGDFELTRTGDLVGTPRYMAPEQFKAEPSDARTDQFSFCIALYEALYGQRPFEGDTVPALLANVIAGRVVPPPAKTGVPGWIRRVVLRGLEVDPDRRFPSMRALLEALENDPTARRRRVAIGVGVATCVVLAAVGARRFAAPPRADCGGGVERWAAVWTPGADSARRGLVHAAFAATGKPYAEQAFTTAAAELDAYARRWLGVYEDACLAHARGAQSAEVLDLRMSCLDERLTTAGALTDLFTRADDHVVENALAATGSLPRLERCSNVTLLKAVVPPPEGEALRRRVDALRAEVAHLTALRDAGHCQEAERLADDLLARVREAGYAPLLADALVEAALLGDQCADVRVSLARAEEAYVVALGARHDETAARAAINVAFDYADREHELALGRTWLAIGRATLQRFGGHPLLDASLENGEGVQAIVEGRGPDAVVHYLRSQEARAKILGRDSPDAVTQTLNIGLALDASGRGAEAIASYEDTVARASRVLGAGHPVVALTLSDEGEALNHLRRYAEAHAKFERAVAIWRAAGSDPMFLSYGLTGEGVALLGAGRPLDAIAPLEEALRDRLATPRDAERVGETRSALARALWARPADRPRARALAEKARAQYEAAGSRDAAKAVGAWLAAPTSSL